MSVNINQLGVPSSGSVMASDDARLQTQFPVPAVDTGLQIAGPNAALLAAGQNAPANQACRYLRINYNGTDLWICCSQVHVP